MNRFIPILILLNPFLLTVYCKHSDQLTLDISDVCKDNYSTSIHLTYGAGLTDARIILLRSVNSLVRSCSVLVVGPRFQTNCQNKCLTAFVAELFNYETNSTINGGFNLKSDLGEIIDFSGASVRNASKYQMFPYLAFSKNFLINIHFSNFSGTIKLTTTTAREVRDYGNCELNETYCLFDGHVFCMSKLFECDGNLNCGTPNRYDEYCYSTYDPDNLVFTIIYGTLLLAVLIFFLVQLLRMYVPTVTNHFFIFNEELDYNFVLTTQMLPPLKKSDYTEMEHNERVTRSVDLQIY